MGNMKGLTRGSSPARGGSSVSGDPFAELEEMLNADLGTASRQQAGQRAAQGRREPSFDSLDLDFQAAFESETGMAASRAVAPAASRASLKPSRPTTRHPSGSASRPTHLTDEEIDHELEEVLRNLSAPARPRDRIVVETQSFAPERAAEERIVHAPPVEVDEFEELIRSELAVIRPNVVPQQRAARTDAGYEAQAYEASVDHHGVNYADGPMEYGRPASPARRWKRRMMATASVVVLLGMGGAGAYLLNGASARIGGDDEPLLIKADAEPYKIAPKDPGGRAYPNQNKAVYDRVASPNKSEQTPVQKALLKNAEEPMELPTEDEEGAYSDSLPGVELAANEADVAKDETRVTPATETDETAAEHVLQPRRVKTMRVGPDGRLMPNDEAVTTETASVTAKPGADIAAIADQADVGAPDPVQVATVPTRPAVAPSPRPAPAAPVAKASDAPAATTQVASAMPTGGYFVQIASQPTEASAQQSLTNMGSRYAGVIAGRPLGVLAAEIPGKGTYYRVRVAAGSKEEAASLCSKLKAAGGSCLVTR